MTEDTKAGAMLFAALGFVEVTEDEFYSYDDDDLAGALGEDDDGERDDDDDCIGMSEDEQAEIVRIDPTDNVEDALLALDEVIALKARTAARLSLIVTPPAVRSIWCWDGDTYAFRIEPEPE